MVKTISEIRSIIKDFTGHFSLKSHDGKYVYVNDGWLRLTGLTNEEVIGKTETEIFNTTIADQLKALDNQAIDKKTPVEFTFDMQVNGDTVRTYGIKWLLKEEDQNNDLICSVSDTVNNKNDLAALVNKVNEAIERNNSVVFDIHTLLRQRLLFDYMNEGILVINNKNKINLINNACENMFGYERGGLLNKDFEILIPARFIKRHELHHLKYNEHPEPRAMGIGMDLWAKRKDGTEFPVEISLNPFNDEQGYFVIVFITDITIRHQHEKEIKEANKELEKHIKELKQANDEIRDFAFVSSHHLQEPLRKMLIHGSMLQKSLDKKMNQKEKEHLSKMLQAAQSSRQRIKDFLLFTRLNIEERVSIPVNLNSIIGEAIEELDNAIEEKQAKITVANELPVIMGDPDLIRQLFYNLISNGLKFHKSGDTPVVKIYSRITSNPTTSDNLIEISVKDNGVGFDEKYADKLFHIFQKMSAHSKGTGVGLAISRKICTLHGGNLVAKGKVGEGATFIATLSAL